MRILLILMLFSSYQSALAQHKFGFTINPGISKFTNSYNASNSDEKSVFRFSGNGGLFYQYHTNKFLFGADLLFVQIEGKDILEMDLTDANGNNVGHSTDYIFRHHSYIGMPLYCGFKTKKLNFQIGFQFMYVFMGYSLEKGNATYNGDYYTWENKYDEISVQEFDYGLLGGFGYSINEKISVNLRYYYGIKNIFNGSPQLDWVWKNQQLTLGMSYSILKVKK